MPDFFREYPEASISLKEDSSRTLIQEEGMLDLCLSYASELRQALAYEKLATSFMVLAVPVDSPLVARSRRQEGAPYPVLEGQEWLDGPYTHLAPHTRSGQAAERYFRQLGRRPQSRIYVDDTRSALSAVEQKLGNCLLTAIPHTDKLVRYLILSELPREEQQVYLVTRKNENGSRALPGLAGLSKKLYLEF